MSPQVTCIVLPGVNLAYLSRPYPPPQDNVSLAPNYTLGHSKQPHYSESTKGCHGNNEISYILNGFNFRPISVCTPMVPLTILSNIRK